MTQAAHENQPALPALDQPRRIFYGWFMLPVAMLAVICSSPAQTYGVGVFNLAIRESLGLTAGGLAFIYALSTLTASLPLTAVGALMDRIGPRLTMTGVVIMLGVACAVTAWAHGVVVLFIGFFLLRLFGQGSLGMLSHNTMAMWFNRKLGMVSGIMALGTSLAIAIAPGLNLYLINNFGWRHAYLILGFAVVAIMLPLLATVYRNRPEDIGQRPDGLDDAAHETQRRASLLEPAFTLTQAMKSRAYWLAAAVNASWALVATGIAWSAIAIFDNRGLDAQSATAQMFVAFGVTAGCTQVFVGMLADRLPSNILLTLSTIFMVGTIVALRLANDLTMAYGVGVGMGLTQATMTATMATIWVRYYGRKHVGKIRGSLTTAMVAASALGPLAIDGMFDVMGEYNLILVALALFTAPLIITSLFATPPKAQPATPDSPV